MKPLHGQVDPMRLPSETSLAFWLLVLSAVIASATYSRHPVSIVRGWVAGGAPPSDIWNWAVGPVLVILATAIWYFIEPFRIIRRSGGISVLSADGAAYKRIEGLAALASVRMPVIQLARVGMSQDAQAFGAFGTRMLLGRGLTLVYRKSTSKFDAVILHELGHLAHKDVWKGYVARAAVRGFILVMILNLTIVYSWFFWGYYISGSCASVGLSLSACIYIDVYRFMANTVTYVPFTVIVLWSYALLLRYREFYADQMAVRHGSLSELSKIFSSNNCSSNNSFWWNFSLFHPSSKRRLEALATPLSVFKNSKWLLLLAGILIGATIQHVKNISPLNSTLEDASALFETQFQSFDLKSLQSASVSVYASALFSASFFASFLCLIRIGVRSGLVMSVVPNGGIDSLVELIKGYLLFITGTLIIGKFVANLGPWLNHGWPVHLADYVTSGPVNLILMVAAAMTSSAFVGYLTGKFFYSVYRPRYTLFFCYYIGWCLLNLIPSLMENSVSINANNWYFVLVPVGIYTVIPYTIAIGIDIVFERRHAKTQNNTVMNRDASIHWFLRNE
jgi:Zn-dependent protease with chaperone function